MVSVQQYTQESNVVLVNNITQSKDIKETKNSGAAGMYDPVCISAANGRVIACSFALNETSYISC